MSALRLCAHTERFDRGCQWLRLQHHALAAAKGAVVYRPMTVRGKVAQVVTLALDELVLQRASHHSVVEKSVEEGWKDGEDVKAHRRFLLLRSPAAEPCALPRSSAR